MADISDATAWTLTCNSVQSHAASMAQGCRREAAALIRQQVKLFCERDFPATADELQLRQQQAMFLVSRIGTISHADLMARTHPGASDEIMAALRSFLHRVGIENSPYDEAISLTSEISLLCHAGMTQQFN